MSDTFNAIKKVMLPIPFVEKIKTHTAFLGERCFKPHVIVDLMMRRIQDFDTAAVYVSGPAGSRDSLSTAYYTETGSMVFCFKPDYWETINALRNRLNISTGDLMRLFICSYLFPFRKTALPLKDLAAVFAERKAWQYNMMLTRPVMDLLGGAVVLRKCARDRRGAKQPRRTAPGPER
jgi:hypothetical protein